MIDEFYRGTPEAAQTYITYLSLKHYNLLGGLPYFEDKSIRGSKLLYDVIDSSNGFYKNEIEPKCRSRINICFTMPTDELDLKFVEEAKDWGITNIEPYRIFKGSRCSLYNSMPIEGAELLANYMKFFLDKYAK